MFENQGVNTSYMELCIKHIPIMFWIIVVFKVHEINYFIDKYHIWTISFFYQGLKGCKYVQCVKLTPIKYMYTYIYISLFKRIWNYNISYISGGYDRKMVVVKLIWDKKTNVYECKLSCKKLTMWLNY